MTRATYDAAQEARYLEILEEISLRLRECAAALAYRMPPA